MRQYGKCVFSLFLFHGTRATFTKFELNFLYGLGRGRDGAKRKTTTSRLRKKKKKFNENLSACAYFGNKALEEKLNN